MKLNNLRKEMAYVVYGDSSRYKKIDVRGNKLRTKIPYREEDWDDLREHMDDFLDGESLQLETHGSVYDDGLTSVYAIFNKDLETEVL